MASFGRPRQRELSTGGRKGEGTREASVASLGVASMWPHPEPITVKRGGSQEEAGAERFRPCGLMTARADSGGAAGLRSQTRRRCGRKFSRADALLHAPTLLLALRTREWAWGSW